MGARVTSHPRWILARLPKSHEGVAVAGTEQKRKYLAMGHPCWLHIVLGAIKVVVGDEVNVLPSHWLA